jgi:hypothetical protein
VITAVDSFDEALNASAIDAEKRIEAEALPVISRDLWTLHNDGVNKRSGLGE